RFFADFLPGYGRLNILPSVPCRMAIEDFSDHALVNEFLRSLYTMEKVHNMTCHKGYFIFFTGSHHLVTILIIKSNGFFTEYILSMLSCFDDRFLMQIVRRRNYH